MRKKIIQMEEQLLHISYLSKIPSTKQRLEEMLERNKKVRELSEELDEMLNK